jgi:hypothetical protein
MNQTDEINMLMQDPASYITFQTNGGADGRRVLNGSAFVRQHSVHRDKFISPSRSYHNLPHDTIKDMGWTTVRIKGQPNGTRWKSTDTIAPVYICAYTFSQLVKAPTRDNVLIPSATGDTMERVITSYEVINGATGDTMARGITSYEDLIGMIDDEPLTEEDEPLTEEDMPLTEEDEPLTEDWY